MNYQFNIKIRTHMIIIISVNALMIMYVKGIKLKENIRVFYLSHIKPN